MNMKRKHFAAFSYFNEVSWFSSIDRDTSIDGDVPMGATGRPDANQL